MGLSTKAGTFLVQSSSSAGTTIDVTCGFQPKAIIVFGSGQSSASDAVSGATLRRCFGFGVSDSERGCVANYSLDAAADASTAIYQSNAWLFVMVHPTTVPEIDGALDLSAIASWPSDGFRVVIDTQFVADMRISFLALGGTDISNAKVSYYQSPAAAGNFSITSVGFQPDVLFLAGVSGFNVIQDGSTTLSPITFGVAKSSSEQAVWAGGSDQGSADMDTASICFDGAECMVGLNAINPATIVADRWAFVEFLANGFTLNRVEGTSGRYFIYLVIEGSLQVKVGSLLTRTDTNDIVVNDVGFQPNALLFVSAGKAESTADLSSVQDRWSMGAATSTTERVSQAVIDVNGGADAVTTTAIEYDEVYVNLDTADAVQGLMDVKSIDSGGFTCVMDDTDPSQSFVFYVAFGAASGGASQISGTAAGTSTASAEVTGDGELEGASIGISTAAALLTADGILAGTIAGTSTATVVLEGIGSLAGSSVGLATLAVILTATGALAGASDGLALVAGTLTGIGAGIVLDVTQVGANIHLGWTLS